MPKLDVSATAEMHELPDSGPARYRWIRPLAWSLLVLLAGLQVWGQRHVMNPDGVSYLDLADGLARGEWRESISGYWSPLYPWMLGFALKLTQPSPFWQFTVAHLVNFFLFLAALSAFEFFLSQLLAARLRVGSALPKDRAIPDWIWRTLGYSVFGWSTFVLIGLGDLTPDLTVAAIVYLASGLVIRQTSGRRGWQGFALLGATLGVGYLAKAAMLPLSIAFVLALWLGRPRAPLSGIAVTLSTFAIVVASFAFGLSYKVGNFTLGETAKLNYAWWVNGVTLYKHWQGDPPGTGEPLHSTRLIMQNPRIYMFAEPVKGTYPVWYDPSYWHEGLRIRFSFTQQLRRMLQETQSLVWVFADLFLPCAVLFVLFMRRQIQIEWRRLFVVGAPAAAAVGMYSLVHVEGRFVAGFLGVLATGIVIAARPLSDRAREAMVVVMLALAILLGARMLQQTGSAIKAINHQAQVGAHANRDWIVASELRRAGVAPNTTVALIGDGFRAYWARLGRYRIVGEGLPREFWAVQPSVRAHAVREMHRNGAKEILAIFKQKACPIDEGWIRVRNTRICLHRAKVATPPIS